MKKFGVLAVCGSLIPVLLPLAVAQFRCCDVCNDGCPCAWIPIALCICIALLIGHVLMVQFLRSLRVRTLVQSVKPRTITSLSDDEVSAVRKFLNETFGGDLRLETGYRFPNGFRGDLVAIKGRGRYPIMCFEVVRGKVNDEVMRTAIGELQHVSVPFANLTQCFILKKSEDGAYQLMKVRGQNTQIVGSFAPELRDEIEESAEQAIRTVKRERLMFPICFLLCVVTPIIICIALLAHKQFHGVDSLGKLLMFWMGVFLATFGVGINGYQPNVSDLMKEEDK